MKKLFISAAFLVGFGWWINGAFDTHLGLSVIPLSDMVKPNSDINALSYNLAEFCTVVDGLYPLIKVA